MGKLIQCVECGKQLDSILHECPHCHKAPYLIECVVCDKPMRVTEGVEFGGGSVKETPQSYGIERWKGAMSHKACKESWLSFVRSKTVFKCRTCHARWSYDEIVGKWTCPKCGSGGFSGFNFGDCDNCGLTLQYGENSVDILLSSHYSSHLYAHKVCVPMLKKRRRAKGVDAGCFIVTATCGENSLEVETLRDFRDRYLLFNKVGTHLIATYEKLSPPLAEKIRENKTLRTIAKFLIVTPAYRIAKIFTDNNNRYE